MSPVLALLRFLFPLGGALAGGRRLFARLYALVCVLALAALAGALVGSGPVGALSPLAAGALAVAVALVAGGIIMRAAWFRRDRAAWVLIGFGMADWALGWAMWTARYLHISGPPPSLSLVDLVWLPTLPLVYLGIGRLVSTELQGVRRALWLDGLIVGGATAAYANQFVLGPLLHRVESTDRAQAAITASLVYPTADLVVLGFVAASFWVSRWRLGRRFALIGAAGIALFVGDLAMLVRAVQGSFHVIAISAALYAAGAALIGVMAWRREQRFVAVRADELRMLAGPLAFTLLAAGLLVSAPYTGIDAVETAVAGATVAAGVLRIALTVRDMATRAPEGAFGALDPLTRLPNRDAFQTVASTALSAAAESEAALLLMDLDRFKDFNDTLGHRAGDLLLEEVAKRLDEVRLPDEVLARLGGDEFAVLVVGGHGEAAAARYRAALARPIRAHGILVHVDASVGIAYFPTHGESVDVLLQRADVAMFEAKAGGLGMSSYDPVRDPHSLQRLSMVGDLHEAIDQRQLVLHYQPQISIADGALVGVEALVRWQHPAHGLIAPGGFIPMVEETRMTGPLTRHVIDLALGECRVWLANGRSIPVAVNASAANLIDPDFPDDVIRLLASHGVPPSLLRLEVTETALATDPIRATATLRRLHGLGVESSLDDFGTGYSSLTHLKQFAVAELKIDRSFVANLLISPSDAEIVRSTIELAQRLSITVVAEGVENPAILARLAEYGCQVAQGFHLARPLTATEFHAWLTTRESRGARAAAA